MTDSSAVYGVLGATGQQGGAVVDALLDRGERVRAIVRSPDSERGKALAARGVEVVAGDQDDPDSLRTPFGGLESLFVVTTFADDSGTEGETRRGKAVVDVAEAVGVPRIVYSSVGGAERDSGVPHFESKYAVEQYLEQRVPATVVRPVFFMENLAYQLDPAADEVVIRFGMPGDVLLQMIAVRDIGIVAAAALVDPSALGGPALEIAGDELTGEQIAAAVGAHLGKPARYEAQPAEAAGDDDLAAMFRWFVDTPAYRADFDRTRAVDPGVLDLAGWLAARPEG